MNTSVRLLVLLVLMVTIPTLISSGQVSISSDNSIAHSSAMLEVKSTDRGFLPPRVELSGINLSNPVTSPATGLLVYNTATAGTPPNNVIPGYYYWNGTLWISLTLPQGTNPGDMIYWGGMQWVVIPSGVPGQVLQLSLTNLPTWSGSAYAGLTTTAISSITAISASSGGNITSDGGGSITARGVCWSKSSNPTTANSKTTDGTGTGSFTSAITGLELYTVYYVRAYATNDAGTAYGNEISFRTQYLPIGSNYQGGKIAYILLPGDPGYIAGQENGLIAAPSDLSTSAPWGCSGTVINGADGTVIGTGNQNTIDIMAGCSTAGIAARLCGDLVLGGYDDWYLPGKDELHKLYLSQGPVGGYTNSGFYWSSSENDLGSAWCEQFMGNPYIYAKSIGFYVRAIRAF